MGTPFHWGGCARFETVISGELLETMQRGGCRMILFGLESASEAIMDRMIKGTKVEDMSRILVESAEAGIWNHTFFFFGFPGETLEDAQETVNFLFEHKQYIHSAAMGTFLMERYSPAHRFPQNFGVSKIVEDPDKDLAIYFDYEVESGDGCSVCRPDCRSLHGYTADEIISAVLRQRCLSFPVCQLPE